MRQKIPLFLCFITGFLMTAQFFVPHPWSQSLGVTINNWTSIIGAFALVLGTGSLIRLHYLRIRRHSRDWVYSIFVFIGLIGMTLVGLIDKGPEGSHFRWLYRNIQVPLDATMFSLLAFFLASAAYRAFRARTLDATLLLIAAVLVMLGNAVSVVPFSAPIANWILEGPNMAARRGILIGIGLGVISQSLKIILGIERSYLRG